MKRKRENIKKQEEPKMIGNVRIRKWMSAEEIAYVRKVQKEQTRQILERRRVREKEERKRRKKYEKEAKKNTLVHFFAHYFYDHHN